MALICYRYGNCHSVLSEPSPHPVLSETGSPGDTDYKTLQLRLRLHQLLSSGRSEEEEDDDEKHLEMRSVSPAHHLGKDVRLILITCTF